MISNEALRGKCGLPGCHMKDGQWMDLDLHACLLWKKNSVERKNWLRFGYYTTCLRQVKIKLVNEALPRKTFIFSTDKLFLKFWHGDKYF